MASETTNINLDVFNVVGDGNMDFQTWSQKISGEVDSNMVKIDTAIGTINGEIDVIDESLTTFSKLINRKGGDPTNWGVPGSTSYTLTGARIQIGSLVLAEAGVPVYVYFPVVFSGSVIPQISWSGTGTYNAASPTVAEVYSQGMDHLAVIANKPCTVYWSVYGPPPA
jgi:hypothetical protein